MGRNTIKGLTVEIGGDTTKLGKALESSTKKSSELSSELGQINRLLKLDPTNTELLSQKQKVLAEAISNTESKLDTLREAEKQVQEQFEKGEVSEAQYRELQREIIATEGKLKQYKNAAEETAEALEELADSSGEAAEGLDDAAEKADKAADATEDLGADAADAAKNGVTALAAAATAVVAALVASEEASREYRTEMGKLNTSYKTAGFNAQAAYKTYSQLQGVLGETDQAVEASNHLAQLCDTEKELADMSEAAIGVFAVFGDSLPVENIAEAANESAKTGQVVGGLADALNWAAVEGETFGQTLKENIKFSEKTESELANMTDAQRASYEATKAQYEEIEAYNKALGECVTAEDYFNLALQECANEQERQQLIVSTLSQKYKAAAAQYKATNKEVIRANEVTEKWNKKLAEVGEYVAPVVTDLKDLGIALVEDAAEPLKDVANFVRQKILPALTSLGSWVKKNLPYIASGLAGVTAALVAHKVAVLSAELATKGLTIATVAQQAAQKALNAVTAASPWGLVATAIAGVTTAVIALSLIMDSTKERVDILTAAERDLMAAADEAAAAFREQQAATQETMGGIGSQMGHIHDLATELQGLADASGNVKQKDQERVNFILNELNSALDTEYQMIDGVILKYDELKTGIEEVIKAKLANSLLETDKADYLTAIQEKTNALANFTLKEKDLADQKKRYAEADEALTEADAELWAARESGNQRWIEEADFAYNEASDNFKKEKALLADKQTAYDQAAADYYNYYNKIADYEEAQTAALQGNYDRAVELLTKKGAAFGAYSAEVDEETAAVLNTLHQEAIDAGLAADRIKRNFEDGVEGYTEEMVKEAEQSYEDALSAFANAYADAKLVGEDVGEGLIDGLANKRKKLIFEGKSVITDLLGAIRTALDSHSPSRKTIEIGEDVGEGAEIGIKNKTKDVRRAATDQAAAILDVYSTQELAGQKALRGIAEQQASRISTDRIAAASSTSPMLERILEAIQAGQVLVLNDDTLVGSTAGKMDNALGMRRILVERGAL